MTSLFTISKTPTEELKKILRENLIGTPGKGMLYQHTSSDEKLQWISKPFFVNLIRFKKILGTCTFSVRDTIDNAIEHHSVYLRYFYFDNRLRRNSPRTIKKDGTLRKEIDSLLNGEQWGLPMRHFHYAYYDPSNERSVLFCRQYGFEEVRSFSTVLFTRLSTKARSGLHRVQELGSDEVEQMKALLSNYYRSYTMFSYENLFRFGKYYVLKDDSGGIVAGLQVNPDRWKLLSLKPPFGKLKLDLASRIPFLKHVVTNNLSFLSAEGVYCRDGHHRDLEQLLEYLLGLYERNVAILFVDDQSSLKKLFDQVDVGVLGRLNSGNKAKTICRFQGFTEKERKMFDTQPAYISSIDLT